MGGQHADEAACSIQLWCSTVLMQMAKLLAGQNRGHWQATTETTGRPEPRPLAGQNREYWPARTQHVQTWSLLLHRSNATASGEPPVPLHSELVFACGKLHGQYKAAAARAPDGVDKSSLHIRDAMPELHTKELTSVKSTPTPVPLRQYLVKRRSYDCWNCSRP